MGVNQQFADTRKAQETTDGYINIRIPAPIADEFDLQGGDDVLFTHQEGDEAAKIHKPR